MNLISNPEIRLITGSFCSKLNKVGDLEIPYELFHITHKNQVRTVEQLLSWAQTFPSSIMTSLNWSLEEVDFAFKELLSLVENKLNSTLVKEFKNPSKVNYAFGVNSKV